MLEGVTTYTPDEVTRSPVKVQPSNAAYVLFTSGSTGKPKAIIVEHSALCGSMLGYRRCYQMNGESRVLQFSSYVFDVSLSEMFETLIFGGTICTPTDRQRLDDLTGFINEAKVNTAMLTSSFLKTLDHEELPTITTLMLVGEAPTKEALQTWTPRARVINAYGPSEVSVFIGSHEYKTADEQPTNVGRAFTGNMWIVESGDYNKLAPIGCIGEILIERNMARGYLNDEERTRSAFIPKVDFLPSGRNSAIKFHRSGDLGRYNADGTIEYLGRRDTQVKLRGYRIELGEIEWNIQSSLADTEHVAADVVKLDGRETLVAFISFEEDVEEGSENSANLPKHIIPPSNALKKTFASLSDDLRNVLPSYMVPSLFVPLYNMPFNTSLKLDRGLLRQLAASLTKEHVAGLSLDDGEKVAPTTEMEFKLRDLWAAVLKTDADSISKHDSFLRVGGDSMSAIRLVSLAQKEGVSLTVAGIFANPRLSAMAVSVSGSVVKSYEAEPFSLLYVAENLARAEKQCNLEPGQRIEDCYPVTSLQEGLMALAIKQSGSYTAQIGFVIAPHVNVSRFRAAWERTLQLCANLRTRIVNVPGGTMQVLVKSDAAWEPSHGLSVQGFKDSIERTPMGYGSRLCRYAIIQENGKHYFQLAMHHAIYDGWTMSLVMRTLIATYLGQPVTPLRPYVNFVKYVMELKEETARDYWAKELEGATQATFPPTNRNGPESKSLTATMIKNIKFPATSDSSITKATIVRAAWAMILAKYSDTSDVTFGMTLSGRQAPVPGLDEMAGAVIATVPVRVRINDQGTVHDFLQNVQAKASEMIAYEQTGMQNISKINAETQEACNFTSLLIIQPFTPLGEGAEDDPEAVILPAATAEDGDVPAYEGYFNYPLVMQAYINDVEVTLSLTYDTGVLTESRLEALCHHFDHCVQELVPENKTAIEDLSVTSPWDIEQTRKWQGEEPIVHNSTFHEVFEQRAAERPDSLALHAWDLKHTYAGLNAAANRLSHHLVNACGIKPNDIVALCMEKSGWHTVSILAVNKAGATWTPLDPSHPRSRYEQIVGQTKSKLILTLPSQLELCEGLAENVLQLTPELDAELLAADPSTSESAPVKDVPPSTGAYILFTSGSTGVPKGVVIEHHSLVTSQRGMFERFGMTHEVRMLQFCSYVFDLSISEIVAPLLFGASIHTPSEETRMNRLGEYMAQQEVDWCCMTPSVSRTLKPESLPALEFMLLAGEAVGHDVLNTWFGKIRLVNGWGPTETTVCSLLHEYESISDSPGTVGRPVGAYVWLVDPEDPQKLAPIGTVGEIVIQGTTLLREYLSDPEKTSQALIEPHPAWAPKKGVPGWTRFYKSGDLAFYNPDGTMEFSTRKDTQVKIRGLRVELGEVEHHVLDNLPGVRQVAVDVYKSEKAAPVLVAYFCHNDDRRQKSSAEDLFLPLDKDLQMDVTQMKGKLGVVLPRYMVPSMFIPCAYMPANTSQKLDRKTLKQLTTTLSQESFATYSLVDADKRPPETEMESRIQLIWAEILNLPRDSIGRDDSFLGIGGDSISAIYLTTAAREQGIEILVKNIFDDPRLSAVAATAVETEAGFNPYANLKPFDLVDENIKRSAVSHNVRKTCDLTPDQVIENAMPVTSLQEGLMALSVKQPGSYIAKWIYKIADHIDIDDFKAAWNETVRVCAILRSRIVHTNNTTLQIFIKDDFHWEETEDMDLDTFLKGANAINMTMGSRLARYAVTKEADTGDRHFIFVAHHAIYDGWTMRLFLSTLADAYNKTNSMKPRPFDSFIKYVQSIDVEEAKSYWRNQLDGARRADFPPVTAKSQDASATRVITRLIKVTSEGNSSITKASVLRAAWAMVLARYSDTDDITFGTSVSGRQAPIPGLGSIAGPVVATIPIRVRLDNRQTVGSFLKAIQSQASEMIAYEQFGMQNIGKLSHDIHDATNFTSLLVVQPFQKMEELGADSETLLLPATIDADRQQSNLEGYFSFPLVLQTFVADNEMALNLTYDSTILGEQQMNALLSQVEHTINTLLTSSSKRLEEIMIAGEWDLHQAMKSNSEVPEILDTTFPAMVAEQARIRPNAMAIRAWDATLTYDEFNTAANKLASYLVTSCNVSLGDLVHVCFEKSAWHFVAILAINKAGAAWVPLDPSHPEDRLAQVCGQTQATIALASPANSTLCRSILDHVIEVTSDFISKLSEDSSRHQSGPGIPVQPRDAMYVLFTSGSTGVPKGLVMEHGAVCTSQRAIAKRLGLNPAVNMLQFAAFVFDLSIGEIIGPLTHGATISVPSDDDRMNNLPKFITDNNVNWTYLTPAFARTLEPSSVPTLELLLFAGEAVGREVFNQWFGKLRLVNGWGPAETCCFSTLHEWKSASESPLTIGQPVGSFCWVVEPGRPHQLAPVGTVGEVVLQGPTLLREYLADADRTAESTLLHLPEWAPSRNLPHWNRFYLSGDLCFYNSAGFLEFSSRKDTQVKIRGLRVELSEVEHHVQSQLEGARQVAVDVFKTDTGTNLVAYFCFSDGSKTAGRGETFENMFTDVDVDLNRRLTALVGKLSVALPRYMVPTLLIPCS
mgnify:CR=1 FL=1